MIQRGFCAHRDFIGPLKASGLTDKDIYLDGRGAEDFDACMASFRARPGKLLVAPDLTCFGKVKRDIAAVMATLEKAKIRVLDIVHPQDITVSEMLQRAFVRISGARNPDPRSARRRGRQGGLARGRKCRQALAGICPDWLLTNIANETAIPWGVKIRLLENHVSEATLRRHFLVPA